MSEPCQRRFRPRTDRARVLLVLGMAAAVTVFTATVPLLRDWFDLRVYHGAIDTWVHHGGRIYDYLVPGTTYGFTYPPFAAVVMLPMALVGLSTAIVLCLALDLVALAAVLYVLVGPVLRRYGWFGVSLALCVLALFEPLRDTVSFGQVNLLLLALVLADAWLLATGRGRWAGVGIGLAAAVKLTPAIFIGLLLLARRWRAAGLATAVAAAATAAAAWIAPAASRFYWTEALWDTSRIGRLDYVSNQSLQGVLARLVAPHEPSRAVWAALVLAVLCVWVWRVRTAMRTEDWTAAFALTGLTACLVSPITWVHHLVWLLPSFAVLLRHRRLLPLAAALYVLLCSSVVWLWFDDASGIGGFVGSNTYVWITLGLLLWLPVGQPRLSRPFLSHSASATQAAPTPAAPVTVPADDQPGAVTSSFSSRAGGDPGAARGPAAGRGGSSEPTASTRPAARKPQSRRERASS
ncbi:glycosyltransferase 87 family protein [Streptomyces europaeiscabiei]|uniref:glycosyltransferase 87 family protein n=1 Tax=Streptomyces europaeiscabiei TaxID=146819 RepID=UPI0029AC665A|nr:glycosyltransferase 87 family protein [Streptomyces europaeiscabiei]MDX3589389.1 glycosyltransferase 87 family protein [Streptomyces europaeiscabiei]MDX3635584.1 glycosyltransferase 87 family protein [Streptomyces europaeiscabiei]MDX3653815.1 glycosyltransferase 87 family protein [Streptomyces europaeiscabiei]